MPKALTILGFVIAILILILFVADLAIGFPFDRHFIVIDICFILSALMLGYMSWNALKDLR